MFAALPDAEPEDIFGEFAANDDLPSDSFDTRPSRKSPGGSSLQRPTVPVGNSRRHVAPPARELEERLGEQPGARVDPRPLSQQIMEYLEKYKIAASSQLRIEVHDGIVVVAGEVPSAYEKQLVGHFCRQLPAVVKFVDGMVVRKAEKPDKRRAPATRRARQPREWNLPFRVQHAGAVLGLVVLVWGAISFGRGQGGPERLVVHPVAGELRFEEQPASGATILHPQDPSIPVRPRATVHADGTFEVTTYRPGDGAPAGRYKATIEWRRAIAGQTGDENVPPNALPATYASPQSTPVELKVEEGENPFTLITAHN